MKGRSTMISNFIYSNGIIEIFVFIAITILLVFIIKFLISLINYFDSLTSH